jgi:hypothetical protein
MSNAKDKITAANLTQADITVIQEFVDRKLIAPKRSMPSGDIYSGVKASLLKDLGEPLFKLAFSANVKLGIIVGIESARRAGYTPCKVSSTSPIVTKPEPKEESTEEDGSPIVVSPVELVAGAHQPAPLPAPKPVNNNIFKHAHHLWIGRRMFKVTRTFKDLETLVCEVLGGMKSEEGNVVFNGEKYSCNTNAFVLEKFITTFFGAIEVGNTDPELNNDSGVPVELRI